LDGYGVAARDGARTVGSGARSGFAAVQSQHGQVGDRAADRADEAGRFVKNLLEADPPYGCEVTFELEKAASGWNAPALSTWLAQSVDAASREFFGEAPAYMGEGGSIPFMGMLGEKFPAAQFLITGVLGPHSNAHGPNEFLHIPTGKRVSMCVARIVADHCAMRKAGSAGAA
jgi:acetylornithine deacetylase/succinyl-diaminopimelate desuccinylase-like protein